MKFQIVYDKPGRIRFRCGAYAFDKELETAVQKQMLNIRQSGKQRLMPKTAVFWSIMKKAQEIR